MDKGVLGTSGQELDNYGGQNRTSGQRIQTGQVDNSPPLKGGVGTCTEFVQLLDSNEGNPQDDRSQGSPEDWESVVALEWP